MASALAVLSGCIAAIGPGVSPGPTHPPLGHAVVAVIDTGIDPYHGVFHRVAPHDIATLGPVAASVETVHLSSTGGHAARRESDAALWDGLEAGTLYRFAGTNVLAISFADDTPVWDDDGHGTAVAGALVDTDPHAWVVVVDGMGAKAEAWVAAQGWIDIVSMSYGAGAGPAGAAMQAGTRAMWDAGQVPVVAAGNTAGWAPDDAGAGPPWVIGVSGDDPLRACTEPGTPEGADVSAAFHGRFPQAGTLEGWSSRSGTSFAAPVVAGVLSATLRGVRGAWDAPVADGSTALAQSSAGETLWPHSLRDALFAAAEPFAAPCDGPAGPAWQRHGHGHVGADLVQPAVRQAFLAAESPPAWPEAHGIGPVHAYREARWT